MMSYEHTCIDGTRIPLSAGKVICIGKNYRSNLNEPIEHSSELPVLFMKPSSALVPLELQIRLPDYSPCYYEVELAVLIGTELHNASAVQAENSVAGYAVALDLTLKELLDEQKRKGRPWELAKAFDRSCPISPFVQPEHINTPLNTIIQLTVNGEVMQKASTNLMIKNTFELIALISNYFTLNPGDIVLTGTPEGSSILQPNSKLSLSLDEQYHFKTTVYDICKSPA